MSYVSLTRYGLGVVALLLLILGFMLPASHADATISQQTVKLFNGGRLRVDSTQNSIRKIVVQGNITAARISNNTIPAKNFSLSSSTTQFYTVYLWLSLPGSYVATISLDDPSGKNSSTLPPLPSFYLSGGDLNLTIFASFEPADRKSVV